MFKLGFKCVLLFHRFKDRLSVDVVPRGCNKRSCGVYFSYDVHRVVKLILTDTVCVRKNDRRRKFYLVAIKFREVFHIHLAFRCVDNGSKGVQLHVGYIRVLNGSYNVAQFSYARRLDNYSVGVVIRLYFRQRFAEVTHKTATNAAGVHLGYLYSRFFEKTAVNTYLAEFVFNNDDLLASVRFFY